MTSLLEGFGAGSSARGTMRLPRRGPDAVDAETVGTAGADATGEATTRCRLWCRVKRVATAVVDWALGRSGDGEAFAANATDSAAPRLRAPATLRPADEPRVRSRTSEPDPDPDGLAHRYRNFEPRPRVEVTPEPEPVAPSWTFDPTRITTRDGSEDTTSHYNIPRILEDIPAIWDRIYGEDIRDEFRDEFVRTGGRNDETYGELFTRVGIELDVDPLALATYSIFESYDIRTTETRNHGSYNPHMRDVAGSMHAAGIAATQAQYVHGRAVPGLELELPDSTEGASRMLRANPELGLRFLAEELTGRYAESGDLSETMIRTAFPAWSENQSLIGYGTQQEYVSRAYAVYQGFVAVAE